MANEVVKITDQNGVDHPIKDLAAFPRSEQAVLGAISVLRRFKGNDTINGVGFTVDDNDIVTLSNSTASDYVSYNFVARNSRQLKIPVGTWKIIPRKTGSDDSRFVIGSGNTADGTGGTYEEWARCNNEPVIFTVDATKSNRYITAAIVLNQGQSANSTWQPMIVPADFPDNVDYSNAMTNSELTPHENATDGATTSFAFDTNGKTLVKQGNIVVPYLRVTGVTVTGNDMSTPICVLADGYKPRFNRVAPIFASGQIKMITIYTDGKIVCADNLTNATVSIMIPWTV